MLPDSLLPCKWISFRQCKVPKLVLFPVNSLKLSLRRVRFESRPISVGIVPWLNKIRMTQTLKFRSNEAWSLISCVACAAAVLPWCCCCSSQEPQGSSNLQCLESTCQTSHCFAVPTWPFCLHHYTRFRTNHNAQCEGPSNWCSLSIPNPLWNHRIFSARFFQLGTTLCHLWGQSQVQNIALTVLDKFCGQSKAK